MYSPNGEYQSFASGGPTGGPPVGGGVPYGPIAGIVSTLGQLYDSHQQRKAASENTDKTIAANKSESELAYQRSVEMWNMQNAYNSPESQMQRFRDAGLNTHLIYGRGDSGNASSPPQYQPAQMQHRYVAGNYGESIASIIPTMMSVGTWLQNMRLSEVEINKKETEMERTQQMIDFLLEMNPQLLKEKSNKLDLFPYQSTVQRAGAGKAQVALLDMLENFHYQWGGKADLEHSKLTGIGEGEGGAKAVQLRKMILENSIKSSESKLKEAQASWTEYGITSPQSLMQMVLGATLGLAGINRSAPRGRINPVNRRRTTGELPLSRRRLHPARRVQRGN